MTANVNTTANNQCTHDENDSPGDHLRQVKGRVVV